nr:unnamed protein product [Spirometra erinaceieuropaei]
MDQLDDRLFEEFRKISPPNQPSSAGFLVRNLSLHRLTQQQLAVLSPDIKFSTKDARPEDFMASFESSHQKCEFTMEEEVNNQMAFLDVQVTTLSDGNIKTTVYHFKNECEGFLTKTEEFQSLSKNVLELFESLAAKVERMKMRAIGSRNRLKLISKQKLEQQELLESRVLEARIECERLRMQMMSLQKEESEQKDFIQNFLMHR